VMEKSERIASCKDCNPLSLAMILLIHVEGSGCAHTASKNREPCSPTGFAPCKTALRKFLSLAFLAEGLELIVVVVGFKERAYGAYGHGALPFGTFCISEEGVLY